MLLGRDMRRVPVDSSVIATVGYSPKSKLLEVEFQTGFVYQYYEVPKRVYDALMRAKSVGSYFNRFIRDKYRFSDLSTAIYEEFR
ncbi:MAG TPA: KTSC domain-containing protein [Thermoanaerobaculia bacterium]